MMPVEMQPEPNHFNELVRIPGQQFLAQIPHPRKNEWKTYWTRVLAEMDLAYRRICNYCAQWIPHSSAGHSIDHFLPRDTHPQLAYEWSNFRYVSRRFNSRKGVYEILDPFDIKADWFIIDFSSFFIKPNQDLPPDVIEKVSNTIKRLKLNEDEDLVRERQNYVCLYCHNEIPFSHLRRRAPFIAYELERQGLVEEIKTRLFGTCPESI